MKAVNILYFVLATAVSASPIEARQSNQVTLALSNDQTGAYASTTLAADGTQRRAFDLFQHTSVNVNGQVRASSSQLTAFQANTRCVIVNHGATIATLTARATFADLDGNPGAVIPVNLNDATITCSS